MIRTWPVSKTLLSLFFAALMLAPHAALAQSGGTSDIASDELLISGTGLTIDDVAKVVSVNIPTTIQTRFGGAINDDVPEVRDLVAAAELVGPGLAAPLHLECAPGHEFQIPGLALEGDYTLQNIRLMRGDTFVQASAKTSALIKVTTVLNAKVTIKQLTPEALRERGIVIDATNFDVYEYTLTFLVEGQIVEIPFPVAVDRTTGEIIKLQGGLDLAFSNPVPELLPRWEPPPIDVVRWYTVGGDDGGKPPAEEEADAPAAPPVIRSVVVIPNTIGVLHQFFSVTMTVTNGAPQGAPILLEDISATLRPPAELRIAKTLPAVPLGRPLPITDPNTGATFLVAAGEASGEWTLEGLRPGTHTFEIELNATYREKAGATPLPLGTRSRQLIHHRSRQPLQHHVRPSGDGAGRDRLLDVVVRDEYVERAAGHAAASGAAFVRHR